MRILKSLPAALFSVLLATGVQAQDETGLPGDNFSLEGALEMFKKAENPEQFEKMLNSKENGVNNLDLNNDGNIDYIRVINKKDGDVQLFVLQSLVSASESQDIAVIQLEKTGNEAAVIQIVGDEDIYGASKIVEPTNEDQTAFFDSEFSSERQHGPNAAFSPSGLTVNVWFWPCVRYVYMPYYTMWVSPWRWYHYPVWWHPWRPLAWHVYQPICYRYRPRYMVVHSYRIARAPRIYRPMRTTSASVYNRNRVVVNNYRTSNRTLAPRTYDRNGSTRPRQFDRTAENRSTPSRTYDRRSDANRSTPSRTFDRRSDADRSTPSRSFDRRPDADRNTPSRSFERRPDVNRSTPSRSFERRPDVNRSTPSRSFERSSSPSNAPRREINRGSISRPQERQMNRSSRSFGGGSAPQRSVQRSPRERS